MCSPHYSHTLLHPKRGATVHYDTTPGTGTREWAKPPCLCPSGVWCLLRPTDNKNTFTQTDNHRCWDTRLWWKITETRKTFNRRTWSNQCLKRSRILSAMQETQETWVQSLGWEDPLAKEMATHSSFLAWKISKRQRSPAGYASKGHKESDRPGQAHRRWWKGTRSRRAWPWGERCRREDQEQEEGLTG